MSSGFLPKNDYFNIKAVFRRLVTSCGGVRECSAINGKRFSSYSEWGSAKHMDRFAPIDAVMDLEASLGDLPIVTEALAHMAGYRLVPVISAKTPLRFEQGLGKVAKECGEVISKLGMAIGDKKVSRPEATELKPEIIEAIQVLTELLVSVDHVIMSDEGHT